MPASAVYAGLLCDGWTGSKASVQRNLELLENSNEDLPLNLKFLPINRPVSFHFLNIPKQILDVYVENIQNLSDEYTLSIAQDGLFEIAYAYLDISKDFVLDEKSIESLSDIVFRANIRAGAQVDRDRVHRYVTENYEAARAAFKTEFPKKKDSDFYYKSTRQVTKNNILLADLAFVTDRGVANISNPRRINEIFLASINIPPIQEYSDSIFSKDTTADKPTKTDIWLTRILATIRDIKSWRGSFAEIDRRCSGP